MTYLFDRGDASQAPRPTALSSRAALATVSGGGSTLWTGRDVDVEGRTQELRFQTPSLRAGQGNHTEKLPDAGAGPVR